jgi:hypothetical protein
MLRDTKRDEGRLLRVGGWGGTGKTSTECVLRVMEREEKIPWIGEVELGEATD